MFSMAREAMDWFEKDKIQMAALVALRGQLDFLARFQACVMERFDAPLSRVSSAIFDLYDNNIDLCCSRGSIRKGAEYRMTFGVSSWLGSLWRASGIFNGPACGFRKRIN